MDLVWLALFALIYAAIALLVVGCDTLEKGG
jgi:hypothetical protein